MNMQAEKRPARTSTTVWGIVVALVGLAVTATGLGFRLDLQASLIVLLVVAGLALLVGAVVSAARRPEVTTLPSGGTGPAPTPADTRPAPTTAETATTGDTPSPGRSTPLRDDG